jgi:hypothetical protein
VLWGRGGARGGHLPLSSDTIEEKQELEGEDAEEKEKEKKNLLIGNLNRPLSLSVMPPLAAVPQRKDAPRPRAVGRLSLLAAPPLALAPRLSDTPRTRAGRLLSPSSMPPLAAAPR